MQKKNTYVKSAERGFFDSMDRLSHLDSMSDPLANLDAVMDWNIFLPVLERIPRAQANGPGGRPAYHPMYMFKILVLQSLYGLSDGQTQFQIPGRRSFHRFLDITEADRVPDQNTIREFREKLTSAGLFDELGCWPNAASSPARATLSMRRSPGFRASVTPANEAIKRGELPDGWENDAKRLSHKDTDARWTKKNEQTFYGYKNQINVDLESKLIIRCEVTDASVHDSRALVSVTRSGDPQTWLDAGYVGPACEGILARKGIRAHICEKGSRIHPLTPCRKRSNRAKSRKRVRVEHVFAFMTGSMKAMFKRHVGYVRNRASIIIANLFYNMARAEQIVRLGILGRRPPQLG